MMNNIVNQIYQDILDHAPEPIKREVKRAREALYGSDTVIDSTATVIDDVKALPEAKEQQMSLLADAEYLISQLMEIIEVVATTDTTYSTGPGDLECVFCNGDTIYDPERSFAHEPNRATVKARELLAREQQNQ